SEDIAKTHNQIKKCLCVLFGAFSVCCCVGKFYKFKDSSDGIGCIEVIFHSVFKFFDELCSLCRVFFLYICHLLCLCCFHQVFQMVCSIGNTLQTVLCCFHQLRAEIQRASVMRAQHKEPEYLQVIFLPDLPYSAEVSERF